MLDLLKKYFGYESFRPGQEEIIRHVVDGNDCLVLMPTGGGKSLCYQLPALKNSGVTLVVSPLISLMKDQVDSLEANGIPARYINSSLTTGEIREIQDQVQAGKIKLLYIAPERLAVSDFKIFLENINLSLIAIDEAHCISEWGHDFRPDYRNLKNLRHEFPSVPIVALTATATERVRADILAQLQLKNPKTFISSFNRPNLRYTVVPKKDSADRLLGILRAHSKESAIIYCFSRNDTEKIAERLRANGITALAYHAGLESEIRSKVQEDFIRDKVQVIAATIAFGMGIDKPDVRLVVHYDLPKSIEGYYQETGRAGRDGLHAECILFYTSADVRKHDFFMKDIADPEEKANAYAKLEQVIRYGELRGCRRAYLLTYFNEKSQTENCANCDVCTEEIEQVDVTEITQKILSAVLRTGERFGAGHIISVLRGRADNKVKLLQHEQLSVFGIAKDCNKEKLNFLINALVSEGILEKSSGQYPVLAVSARGRTFLKQRDSLVVSQPRVFDKKSDTDSGISADYDRDLFEKLRHLRAEIAEKSGVPPYVIFGNRTLQEMATYYPQSPESLREISGVGVQKLDQFGDAFLAVIRDFAQDRGITGIRKNFAATHHANTRSIAVLGTTFQETKKLIEQQLSLSEMVQRRGLASSTIISHIAKLIAQKDLSPDHIEHLRPPLEKYEAIAAAFREIDPPLLSVIKQKLGDDYSYDELHLARIFLYDPK